jgi:transposase-like protein
MKKYSQEFLDQILADYQTMSTREVALKYGISASKVYGIASIRQVKKNPEYMKKMLAITNKNLLESGKVHRFKKGNVSWNKGKYMRVSQSTEFKKGQMPHNYRPVGSERITKDGYMERKIADPKKWKAVHIIVWEEVNGPVPPRHKVLFKDNNKLNVSIDNLLCVSNEEVMKRNSIHRYPTEIVKAIKTISKLKKTIRNHGKKQD